jgi:polyferredoxin
MHRAPLIVEILRDRNALYRETSNGAIENSYTVKLVNKTQVTQHLTLAADATVSITGNPNIVLPAGEVGSLPLTLRTQNGAPTGMRAIALTVSSADGSIHIEQIAQFYAPEAK